MEFLYTEIYNRECCHKMPINEESYKLMCEHIEFELRHFENANWREWFNYEFFIDYVCNYENIYYYKENDVYPIFRGVDLTTKYEAPHWTYSIYAILRDTLLDMVRDLFFEDCNDDLVDEIFEIRED